MTASAGLPANLMRGTGLLLHLLVLQVLRVSASHHGDEGSRAGFSCLPAWVLGFDEEFISLYLRQYSLASSLRLVADVQDTGTGFGNQCAGWRRAAVMSRRRPDRSLITIDMVMTGAAQSAPTGLHQPCAALLGTAELQPSSGSTTACSG